MSSQKAFNSDVWIPDIRNLCLEFLGKLKSLPGGQYLKFSDELGTIENPGKLVKEYHGTVTILKNEIFKKDAETFNIDYHKIAAVYIRSFLKFQPFFLDAPGIKIAPCRLVKLANEYFCLPFLEAIFRAFNKDYAGLLELGNYKDYFIKLLFYYRKNIERLDPLSFAHIIFFVEKEYFYHSSL